MFKKIYVLLFFLLLIATAIHAQSPQYNNNQTVNSINSSPLGTTTYNKVQWLFATGSFGTAPSGNITTIYIKTGTSVSSTTFSDFTVKIGHTTQTSLTTNWVTGLQTCFYAASQTFTNVTSGAWLPITLQTPFSFTATQYMVVEISQTAFTNSLTLQQNSISFTGRVYGNLSSSSASGSGTDQLIMGIDISPIRRNDAGILSINQPASPVTPGSSTVKATLRNYGKDTLKSVALRWSVNGTNQTSPANWSGSLIQNASSGQLTFGTYNFISGTYNIKTWTNSPNGVSDSNAYNDTAKLTLISCYPASGTYVIDAGGTGNFTSFNSAIDYIKNCGISGAVTFRVRPGNYNEQLTIPAISGASSSHTITFESYNNDSSSVTLSYNSTNYNINYVVKLDGADFITFRKMTISATGTYYSRVFEFAGSADYNSLRNNVIQSPFTTNSNYGEVIYSYSYLDQYNTIKDNVISGGAYGIYWYGASSTSTESGNLIEGNDIRNFYYAGINAYYQNAIVIRRNNVENLSASSVYGIYTYYCNNSINISANNIKIYGSSSVYGLYMCYSTGNSSTYGNIYNNFISLGGTSTSTSDGIYLSGAAYQNISFNTVNIYGASSTSKYGLYFTSGTSGSVNFRNNIISNFSTGYAIYISGTSAISTSNYNDLYSNGTYLGYWSGSASNMSAWRSASGKDANSVSVNPGFYSNTDLHVNTTGISNIGTPVTGITADIDGESRNASTPDIGADEFVLATNDAGISSLVSPLQPCPGTANVSVTIKNYGLNSLTSVIVNWQVNGVTQNPDTLTLSLSQYQNTTVSLGTYNFVSGTAYTIKIWTSLPNASNDGNNRNDTLIYKNLRTSLAGTYTIGGTTANYATFNAAVNDLKAKGICGPVLFRVNPGTYTENVIIPSITGTSNINTITFESYNHDSTSVDLNYATGSTDNYVVWVWGADYITFRQMTIRATGSTYGYAVEISGGSDYNTFTNNIIQTKAGVSSSYFIGINSGNSTDNHNSIINNIISGGYYGILFIATSSALENMNIIKNNWFRDFYFYGILSQNQSSIIIEGNRFQNNVNALNCYGLSLSYSTDSIKILKNRIELTGQNSNNSMYIYNCTGTASATGLVANNFISQTGISTTTNTGLYISYTNYLNICNNSVNITSKSNNYSRAVYIYSGSYVTLLNNVIANSGGGYALYVYPGTNITKSDYNDLYTTGNVLGYWQFDLPDLASWKGASAQDTHSVSVNPYFFSATDLHVYNSKLDSSGIVLNYIKTDIDNEPRNPVKPDIGADEFEVYNRDAGVVELIEPVAPCPGTVVDFIVRIRNFGYDTIKTVKIKWTVNGVQQAITNFTANLASFSDTSVFIGTYSLSQANLYDLKFWTDSINGLADQVNKNDTFSKIRMRTAKSGTFTIGHTGRDFPGFTAAVNDLITYGICGPITFIADTGSYNEQISIPEIAGASAINTITFTSASNDSSFVDLNYAASSSTGNYVVELNGADYIRFHKIKIRATGASYGRTVHVLGGADYNIFSNNVLLTGNTSSNASVIYFESSIDNYNTIQNNYISGGYYAINLIGGGYGATEKFNVVKDNIIRDFISYGILMQYQNSPVISGNIIEDSSIYNYVYGIYGYYMYDSVKIERNKIHLSATSAVYNISLSGVIGSTANNALIDNNSISHTVNINGNVLGIYINQCSYVKIYNNSVNIASISNGNGRSLYLYGGSNITIRNNVLAGTGDAYAIYIDFPGSSLSSDYNDLFTNGPYIGFWNAANILSLANWKSASTLDSHSVSGDPFFYSKTDLHPYSIILDSAALSLPEIKTDIDHKVRNTIKPDIGAYEFEVFNHDAGIIALVEPVPPCSGVLSNMVVKLRNFGYDTIKSTRIKWSVNDTIKTSVPFSGVLPMLSDTNIFLGSYTFYKGNSYKLKFWVDTVNFVVDQCARTDTLSFNSYTTALSGTYRIGTGKDYSTFTAAVNDLKLHGVCNMVTFLIDPGKYNEQISIPAIFGASDTKTITFRSTTGDSTSVDLYYAASVSNMNYVVQLDGADYIRFEKMTITSSSSIYAYTVVLINGADHNILRNNIIECPASSSSYACPIYNASTTDNFNLIENNRILNGYYGIYMAGISNATVEKANVIRNNQISGFYYYGLYNYCQDSVEVDRNVFSNSASSTSCYGIYSYYNYNNSRITNNRIQLNTSSGSYGIYLGLLTGTPDKFPLVANNFISMSGSSSGTLYGLYSYYCYNINIFHNSINIVSGGSSGTCLYLDGTSSAGNYGNIDVMNNILVNKSTGYALRLNPEVATGNYLRLSDYNDLYTKGTYLVVNGSNNLTNLSFWQAVSTKEHNSISKDAIFKSTTDLHLSNYSSFTIRNPLAEVPYDIDGDLRSTVIPMIGADERPPIPNDAGITEFISPKPVSCDGVIPIVVKLTNFGIKTLTSVTINTKVNFTNLPDYAFTGSVDYLKDTTVMVGYYSFMATRSYTITAGTTNPNGVTDLYYDNNTDSLKSIKLFAYPVIQSITNDTICKGTKATLAVSSANSSNFFWYDSLYAGALIAQTPVYITDTLHSSRTYYVAAGTDRNPENLLTSKITGLSEMGNMFDIKSLSTDIIIDSFSVQSAVMPGVTLPMAVYYKKGSYVGYENIDSVWTLLGVDTAISTGINNFVSISIGNLEIHTGDTFGLYVTSTDFNALINHSEGGSEISDNYIKISCGTKAFYPFDSYFQTGKTWNGRIYYSTGALCKSARQPVEAIVKPLPQKGLGPDLDICNNNIAVLKTTSYPGFSYLWKKASESDTLSVTDSLIADTSGTYIVYTKDQCGFSSTDTINLKLQLLLKADFSVRDASQCFKGNYFEFTDKSAVFNAKIASYTWNFGDSVINHDSNTNHVYSYENSFHVKLIAVTTDSCYDSITRTIEVNPEPKSAFTINDTNQCFNGNSFISINKSTVKSGTMFYDWKLGDGTTSSDSNIVQSYKMSGSYLIQLNSTTYKGCSDSVTTKVHVRPSPVVYLGKDTTLKHNQTIRLNAGSGMDSYLWSNNTDSQQIVVDTTGVGDVGTKTVWVQVEKNGCYMIDTILIHFIHNDGISEDENSVWISVYPNPASNEIYILNNIPATENLIVSVLNEYGKIVKEVYKGKIMGNQLRIDATKFAAGIYLIKIESGTMSRIVKVVIIK
jgi:hypothetical protein